MKYLSVCSGIEAASVAWHPLGFDPVGFAEVDKFPAAVLATRYPHVQNFGDMNGFSNWDIEPIDVLVGGTPCQSFSVAGLRKGLADARGNLALVYCRILDILKPKWFVWENVPGVLSSGRGRDFGAFLGAVVKLGYGFAYRVLDAQFFGVPQRRRRVFVVGCLGDWRRAASVLFERESLCRNTSKGGSKREGSPSTSQVSVEGNYVPAKARTLSARYDGSPCIDRGPEFIAFSSKDYAADASSIAPTLRAMNHTGSHANAGGQVAIAFNARQDPDSWQERTGPLDTDGSTQAIQHAMRVRRLTPRECERLQGFPDDWTAIEYRGKPACDGPRYKAIGNSMAVPVMRWIGQRLIADF
jgi:DNA (cytosine-5)-methyltransferase 1